MLRQCENIQLYQIKLILDSRKKSIISILVDFYIRQNRIITNDCPPLKMNRHQQIFMCILRAKLIKYLNHFLKFPFLTAITSILTAS